MCLALLSLAPKGFKQGLGPENLGALGKSKANPELNPIGDRVQKPLELEAKELGLGAAGRPALPVYRAGSFLLISV